MGIETDAASAAQHRSLLKSQHGVRDWYSIAEQPAPAPHRAHSEGCAALRIVLVTAPRVSRSCENFSNGFDLRLLHLSSERQLSQGEGNVDTASALTGRGSQPAEQVPVFLVDKPVWGVLGAVRARAFFGPEAGPS